MRVRAFNGTFGEPSAMGRVSGFVVGVGRGEMAGKYSRSASRDVERVMKQRKKETLRSGKVVAVAKSPAANRPSPSVCLKHVQKGKKCLKNAAQKVQRSAPRNVPKSGHRVSVGLTNYWLPGLLTTMGSPTLYISLVRRVTILRQT